MPRSLVCLPLLALLAAPADARAADAHVGVHPERGEIVLLRDVNARHAYRKAPPSIALIVDPTPNREIDHSLGTGEMSDDEIAGMSSGRVDARGGTLPQQMTDRALQGSTGRLVGEGSVLSGSGFGRSVGGATGAITGATRGIAPTVTGALSQFPTGGQGTGP
ncbi:hypothetical protein [Pseudoxanthomonas suwonensis]|uniref:Secreted protein n=1 Tax=Pseudoxanthomonas suwonensis TaxID=314722 RepID=A0A0E3Z1H9_9GAMM|nr:hypothetical protein [Pseudoxanthomonas suwonensis]AKC86704.1 hypothetical protein WQ53_08005 [Pseudoxanthomonas suwonensis]